MTGRLDGLRVLVTRASSSMGPDVVELFECEDAGDSAVNV